MDHSCLFICLMNGDAWGGSEELWYRSALSLAKKGIKTGCVVYEWKEKEAKLAFLEKAGCHIYRMPNLDKNKRNFLSKLLYKFRLSKYSKRLPVDEYNTVIVSQGGFEVVHAPWKKFHKKLKRYFLIFHNYNEHKNFSIAKQKILTSWIRSAEVNLFAAVRIKEVLQKQLSIDIPNGWAFQNPITFNPPVAVTSYPPVEKRPLIFSVFAALDVKRKAQDKLVRILSVQKWKDRPFHLYLYGDGKDKLLLEDLIERSGLKDKVILKGHTNDVATALRDSHMVLHVTDIDAMPLVVVEAMAMGRPLVVTDVGDMPLWIKDGVNGWVTATEPSAINASLEKAWQARDKWMEMGIESFRIFQQRFSQHPEEDLINKFILKR